MDLVVHLFGAIIQKFSSTLKSQQSLARKVVAKTLVSASKAVQKALPESVKKYVGGKLVKSTIPKKAIAPAHGQNDVDLEDIINQALRRKRAIEEAKAEQAQHQQQSSSCTIV